MKKKTIVASVLLGVLLIGIVTAGLVPYLSNMVSGNVVVDGPVFYLNGLIGGVYHELLINEIPEDEEIVNWNDGQRVVFETEPLGVNGFYKAKFDVHIWAKTNNSDGPSNNTLMQLDIIKIDGSGKQTQICDPMIVNLSKYYDTFRERKTSCSSTDTISLNPEDKFGLRAHGITSNEMQEYWISTGKGYGPDDDRYSRIEVTSAT